MHIKSILPAVALALAATLGSAYAADQFTTLDAVVAAPLSETEMAEVTAGHVQVLIAGQAQGSPGVTSPPHVEVCGSSLCQGAPNTPPPPPHVCTSPGCYLFSH